MYSGSEDWIPPATGLGVSRDSSLSTLSGVSATFEGKIQGCFHRPNSARDWSRFVACGTVDKVKSIQTGAVLSRAVQLIR